MMDLVDVYHHYKMNSSWTPHLGQPYLLHQPWLKDSVDANLHTILTRHVRRLPCQKLHLDQLHSALPGRWSQTDHPAPVWPEQNSNQHSLKFQHLREELLRLKHNITVVKIPWMLNSVS